MRELSDIRKDIDRIDDELIELFKERMDCAREVGYYKKERGIPVLNTQRENEVLDDVQKKGGEYGSYARLLFSNIMELSRALQHNIVGSGRELREEIVRSGTTVTYKNGENQYGTKQSPDAQLYLQMSQKQTAAMKILVDCLPKTPAKAVSEKNDGFEDFINERDD